MAGFLAVFFSGMKDGQCKSKCLSLTNPATDDVQKKATDWLVTQKKKKRNTTGEEGGRQGRGHPQLLPGLCQAQPDQRSAEAVLSVQEHQARQRHLQTQGHLSLQQVRQGRTFPAGMSVQGQIWYGWQGQGQPIQRQRQGQEWSNCKHRPGEAVGRLLQRRHVTSSVDTRTGGSHPHRGDLLARSDTWREDAEAQHTLRKPRLWWHAHCTETLRVVSSP